MILTSHLNLRVIISHVCLLVLHVALDRCAILTRRVVGTAACQVLRKHARIICIFLRLLPKRIELLHRCIILPLDLLVKLLEELFTLVLFFLNGPVGEPDYYFFVLVVRIGLWSRLYRRRVETEATMAELLPGTLRTHSI